MAKTDWAAMQKEYLAAFISTGISPKEWCEEKNINYTSARRYIKKPTKTSAKTAQTAQNKNAQSAQKRLRKEQASKSAKLLINDEDLNDQQKQFVIEYLKDKHATQAALRAGYSPKSASTLGYQLLQKPHVRAAIDSQLRAAAELSLVTAADVIAQMWQLATLDANEISELRRGCCRHCWGIGHAYEWTADEYRLACEKAERAEKDAPDCAGGLDYLKTREPNPDCPECGGEGISRVHIHDTRELSPLARLAYAGVKQTKNGIEVLTINKEKMLENIARALGALESPEDRAIKRARLERENLETQKIRNELSRPDDRSGFEDDYQLQTVSPDEPIPDEPIL